MPIEGSGKSGSNPRVSFGVPVRNEEECIARCLDSILCQDFTDFEVIVCDNASTDTTPEILKNCAARDSRIRLYMNEEDIGQIENCNRVFHLSRGEYFKWVGADDWLDPSYASSCVAALDGDPGAIVVTNDFTNHDDRGNTVARPSRGERLESEDPSRRFARMLWFFHAGDALYDPVYGMMRRNVFERTALIRMMTNADWMLAAELSLMGRFCHVPKFLTHRWKPYKEMKDWESVCRGYHPTLYRQLPSSLWTFTRVLVTIIWKASLTPWQRVRCLWPLFKFVEKSGRQRLKGVVRRFLRERLGITRKTIPFWRPSGE